MATSPPAAPDRPPSSPAARPLAPRIVAVIYTGGSVAHLLRLLVGFTWRDMPFLIDGLLVVLGSIGVVGLVRLRSRMVDRGTWERVTHWLIVAHLSISVAVHLWILAVGSHRVLSVFPPAYSLFALAYFSFFAWRSWTLELDAGPGASRSGDARRYCT